MDWLSSDGVNKSARGGRDHWWLAAAASKCASPRRIGSDGNNFERVDR